MDRTIDPNEALQQALRLMTMALDLIDQAGTVTAIGAQLDLARARLAEHLGQSPTDAA